MYLHEASFLNLLVPRSLLWKQLGNRFFPSIACYVKTKFKFWKVTMHFINSYTSYIWYPKENFLTMKSRFYEMYLAPYSFVQKTRLLEVLEFENQ